KDKDIEIKNPDLYLATLAAATDGKENPKLEEEGIIVFDTDYSPVKGGGVNFQEKSIVISQKATEEELTLTITTSGVTKPREALQEVLELSKDSFNSISTLLN
ncbi:8556_t:CDS:2, partial [Ambispora leptoticha]